MKRIRIVCVGKASKPFCRDGINEYLKRLGAFYSVSIAEIPEQPTLSRECDEILTRIDGRRAVLMDVRGEPVTSEGFAKLVGDSMLATDELDFVIGGASGVNDAVRAACFKRVSFGAVTYPHQIARLLLAEQLYRAATILNGLPYHK